MILKFVEYLFFSVDYLNKTSLLNIGVNFGNFMVCLYIFPKKTNPKFGHFLTIICIFKKFCLQ